MIARPLVFATDLLQLNNQLYWDQLRRWACGDHCLVLGDFSEPNIISVNGRCSDLFSKGLLDTIDELGLFQHVHESIRIVASYASILDCSIPR